MQCESQERVFKQSVILHFGLPGVTLGLLLLAIWASLAIYQGDGSDSMFKVCFSVWLATIVAGLSCFALLEWVVVDTKSVSHRKLFERHTIYFQNVTELQINAMRQWISVCDLNGSISCSRNYPQIDELIELLQARIAPFLQAQNAYQSDQRSTPTTAEFRYPKSTWWILMVSCSASAVIFSIAVGSVVREMWAGEWAPERGDSLGFAFGIVSIVASISYAVITYLNRDLMVALDGNALTHFKWGKATRIFYEDIDRIERRTTWMSDDEIVIIYGGGELELPHNVERYNELIDQLNDIVPITRIDDETVEFPVVVRFRLWWAAPVILTVFGLIFFAGSAYLAFWTGDAEDSIAVVGHLLLALGGMGFGGWFMATCVRLLVSSPIQGRFEQDRISLILPTGTREYTSGQVESVRIREEGNGRVGRRLDLRIAGRNYRFYGGYASVSLVPLYELLCKTYWPDGYRDPNQMTVSMVHEGEHE